MEFDYLDSYPPVPESQWYQTELGDDYYAVVKYGDDIRLAFLIKRRMHDPDTHELLDQFIAALRACPQTGGWSASWVAIPIHDVVRFAAPPTPAEIDNARRFLRWSGPGRRCDGPEAGHKLRDPNLPPTEFEAWRL